MHKRYTFSLTILVMKKINKNKALPKCASHTIMWLTVGYPALYKTLESKM